MDTLEKLSYLEEVLLQVTGIFSWHYRTDFTLAESNCSWENELKNFFLLGSAKELRRIEKDGLEQPLYLMDSLQLNWMIVPARKDSANAFYCVIGPVFNGDISDAIFRRQMNAKNMSVASQIRFLDMAKQIPVIQLGQFRQYGAMIYYSLHGTRISPSAIRVQECEKQQRTPASLHSPEDFPAFDIPASHGSQAIEHYQMKQVEDGNIFYSAIDPDSHLIDNPVVGNLCPGDPLRQAKDLIIVFVTITTRAAVRGGMSAEAAYSMSDYYIQQIESCAETAEVYALGMKMYDSFVHGVHETKQSPPLSAPVSYVLAQIHKNLFGEIDLPQLADEVGYSSYYLSALFKKETGKSIKAYINEQKLEAAKILLRDTDIGIAKISERLAFVSPSYFGALFKQYTGMTPKEYRRTSPSRNAP